MVLAICGRNGRGGGQATCGARLRPSPRPTPSSPRLTSSGMNVEISLRAPPSSTARTASATTTPSPSKPTSYSASSSHRPPIVAMSSARVSTRRTGRRVAAAAMAAAAATGCDRADLPPNPPPSRRVRTCTACAGRPSAVTTAACTMSTHWVPEITVMAPPSSGSATAACGSMYMCSWDGMDTRTPRRTHGAEASAASTSAPYVFVGGPMSASRS